MSNREWFVSQVTGSVLVLALIVSARSQPPDPSAVLRELTGAKGRELDEAVRGVSSYPRKTRDAILQLAAYSLANPNLVGDLAKLRKESPAAIDHYLTSNGYDTEVQQTAAAVLVDAPESFERMKERPELVRIIGTAWSTPPGKQLISAILDAAAATQEKKQNAAADRWAATLKADPALFTQYRTLLDDYSSRASLNGQTVDSTWNTAGYGMSKSKDGYVVSDVPSREVIDYALALGYQYSAVASALIQQYLAGNNSSDYNDAVGGWYSRNGSTVPDSTKSDNTDYYAALAALAQQYANSLNSGTSGATGSSGDSGTSGSGGTSGTSGDGGSSSVGSSGQPGSTVSQYPKLSNWLTNHPVAATGQGTQVARLPNAGPQVVPQFPGPKSPFPGGPPPGGKPPFGAGPGGKPPSAAPFSDLLRATPAEHRPATPPGGGANPFAKGQIPHVGPGGSPGQAPAGGTPNLFRGTPPLGQQLSRAQGQMNIAWKPSGGQPGGGPRPHPGGGPRPGPGPRR